MQMLVIRCMKKLQLSLGITDEPEKEENTTEYYRNVLRNTSLKLKEMTDGVRQNPSSAFNDEDNECPICLENQVRKFNEISYM